MPDGNTPAGKAAGECGGAACGFLVAPPTDEQLRNLPASTCRVIQDLTLLLGVSTALQQSTDLKTSILPVLENMALHLGITHSFVTIHDRMHDEMRIDQAYGIGEEAVRSIRYRPGEGVIGRVLASGRSAFVRDAGTCPDFLNRTNVLGSIPQTPGTSIAFLSVPIFREREVVGTINAFRRIATETPDRALDADMRLLTLIAAQIALAVRLRQRSEEEARRLREENSRLSEQLGNSARPSGLVGGSGAMEKVLFEVGQVAPSDITVLVRGESGVGKELVAKSVHTLSPRAKEPFVAVNCAAIPENLIESELFGHERGAFTGALKDRKGKFEMADGGTLFLDEIGEMPANAQAKLLRAIQEKTIEAVGSSRTLHVDVRIVAATNAPLEDMIADGRFRQDLYYRLNVFPVFIPPLRQRKGDILPLADHFVEKHAARLGRKVVRISTPAIDMLMSYHWPGNVRELENVIERAVLLSQDGVIHGYHLPASLQTGKATHTLPEEQPLQVALDSFEREMVVEALKATGGNMAAAARRLGLTERQMGLRVRKYNLDTEAYR